MHLNLLNPWDVLLRHGDWRCATEDVLLRPGLAWLQWSRTSFRCARLNTDVDPRTRDESLRLAKKKKLLIAPGKLEFRLRAFSVIFSVSARRVHGYTPASLAGRRPNIFFRQWKRYWAFSGWQAWSLARFFDETSAEVDCATTNAMAELAIRTVLSAPATEAGIEMNLTTRMSTRFPGKLDFAAGDKICSYDGHLKVSRGEISLVNLLVQLVQLLACWRIKVSVNVRAMLSGFFFLLFFFCFL